MVVSWGIVIAYSITKLVFSNCRSGAFISSTSTSPWAKRRGEADVILSIVTHSKGTLFANAIACLNASIASGSLRVAAVASAPRTVTTTVPMITATGVTVVVALEEVSVKVVPVTETIVSVVVVEMVTPVMVLVTGVMVPVDVVVVGQ